MLRGVKGARRAAICVTGIGLLLVSACTVRATDGNAASERASISAGGRYTAFMSASSDLVAGDAGGFRDIFVWDQVDDVIVRGPAGNADAYFPDISDDGRFVVFFSRASNLVPGDSGSSGDLFVWDRVGGSTTRITTGVIVDDEASISADGRYVAYASDDSPLVAGDDNGVLDIMVWDRVTGTTTRITDGELVVEEGFPFGGSDSPSISADGGRVAFRSSARNLDPDPTATFENVFLWDRATGTIERVTTDAAVTYSIEVSGDGGSVAFITHGELGPQDTHDGADAYVWDRSSGSTQVLTAGDASNEVSISRDGRSLAYEAGGQVHLFDRTGSTHLTIGTGARPNMAAHGKTVAFEAAPGSGDVVTEIYVWTRPSS